MIAGASAAALALAGSVLVRAHHREVYRAFESGKAELARAVAHHSIAPLVFKDRAGAGEILAKLERSTVDQAVLFDTQGEVVAAYQRAGANVPAMQPPPAPARFQRDGYLHVFEPVIHRGKQHGTLYLAARR